ncbi:MAG: hypothetical protein K2G83_07220 [Ruminococcus sp.]|nr:hypothetical protein [Ruminococcus sp.]
MKKKYGDAIWYFGLGTDDTYDGLFFKALKSSLEHGFKADIKKEVDEYMSRYMYKYPDKMQNLEHLTRLLSCWKW